MKWRAYLIEPGRHFTLVTLVPVLVGAGTAYLQLGRINAWVLVLTYAVAVALQNFTHLTNGYFDYMFGTDIPGSPTTKYRRHPIISGDLSLDEVRWESVALFAFSVGVGIFFALWGRPLVIPLGLLSAALCLEYTAPPIKAKYRTMSNLFLFILEGPLLVLGAYYLQTGTLSWTPILTSLPVSFVNTEIHSLGDIKDHDFDAMKGVKTIPVRFGMRFAKAWAACQLVLAYVSAGALVALGVLPVFSLLVFLMAPLLTLNLIARLRGVNPLIAVKTGRVSLIFGAVYVLSLFL
jgi:1,4-dihydroxy-2-naphthoate octaprenyltransferase